MTVLLAKRTWALEPLRAALIFTFCSFIAGWIAFAEAR
jgi:hypothetical protein